MKNDNRCEVYTHYRLCKIKYREKRKSQAEIADVEKIGYFHKWQTIEGVPYALVEMSNGEVYAVSPHTLTFIDDIHDRLEALAKDMGYSGLA